MITSREEAIENIRALGLPQVFLDIWSGEPPKPLKGTCVEPKTYFKVATGLPERVEGTDNLLPLWETDLIQLVAMDLSENLFIRYYYGDKSFAVLGESYQKFIATFFFELIDSGLWDELDQLAEVFGFKYLDQLKECAESTSDENYVEDYKRFVTGLPSNGYKSL